MKNIFESNVTNEVIRRINKLDSTSQPKWGKMNVAQMLAHCCVSYDYIYNVGKYPKPKGVKKAMLKLLVKPIVTNQKPYKKNSRTAPDFLITDEKEFAVEKERLIGFLEQTQKLGGEHFNNKESHAFGSLTTQEWNNMLFKHIDHHLNQFDV